MANIATLSDTRYSLAEAAILSGPWLSTATADVLAEPEIVIRAVEPPQTLRKVVIRKRGSEIAVEILASGSTPRSLMKSIEGVVDLLGLQAGWNSYSAKPIEPRNAIRAVQLLFELLDPKTPTPIVVPTVRGGIQLEWHTKGVDIEVYINSPTDVSFFAERVESDESTEQPLADHEHELKSWLGRISGE